MHPSGDDETDSARARLGGDMDTRVGWVCECYTTTSRCLVLWTSARAPGKSGEPRFRCYTDVEAARIHFNGEGSIQQLRSSRPPRPGALTADPGNPSQDAQDWVIASGVREYPIVPGHYITLGLDRFAEMEMDAGGPLAELPQALPHADGWTVRWAALAATHQGFRVSLDAPSGDHFELGFRVTWHIDLPVTVHDATLRTISAQEWLTRTGISHPQFDITRYPMSCLAIDSPAGEFSVLANGFRLGHQVDERESFAQLAARQFAPHGIDLTRPLSLTPEPETHSPPTPRP